MKTTVKTKNNTKSAPSGGKKLVRIRTMIHGLAKGKTGLVASTANGTYLVHQSLSQYIVTGREHDLDIQRENKFDMPTIMGAIRIMK